MSKTLMSLVSSLCVGPRLLFQYPLSFKFVLKSGKLPDQNELMRLKDWCKTRATTDKELQAQTAECLVVGEIATDRLLVVLNKVDLLPEQTRDKAISRAQKMLLKTFAHTKFQKPSMVSISAKPGLRSSAC